MNKKEYMEDTVSQGVMPEGHIDKGGDVYQLPILGMLR